jgi:hypothetical protein
MLKKKIWPNFPRIIEVFTQKIVTKPSKLWVWDPEVKKAPDPGSGSATLQETILWKPQLLAITYSEKVSKKATSTVHIECQQQPMPNRNT